MSDLDLALSLLERTGIEPVTSGLQSTSHPRVSGSQQESRSVICGFNKGVAKLTFGWLTGEVSELSRPRLGQE